MRGLSRSTVLVCFPIRVTSRSSNHRIPPVLRTRLLTGGAIGRQRVKRLVRVSLEQ
jgi:hypothetical protein